MKILRYCVIIFLFLFNFVAADDLEVRGTKFILLGHLYPIIDDNIKLNKLAEKINDYEADYIFILGDSKLYEKEIVIKLKKIFNAKLFFSPGNTENEEKKKKQYFENIGYNYKIILEKDVRFILIDSNDDVNKINGFLKPHLLKDFNDGPTVLLTHHRIWDDTLIREGHDKTFYFKEIYPLLNNKVNYVFAGNSKRQYFRDLSDALTYGKQNVNLIFWLDIVGKIKNYSIGMGDGYPKATFTIAKVYNNELIVNGDYVSFSEYDILPTSLISSDKHKLTTKYTDGSYIFLNKKKILYFIIILGLIVLFVIIKKNRFN
jgi:hypothetical protein